MLNHRWRWQLLNCKTIYKAERLDFFTRRFNIFDIYSRNYSSYARLFFEMFGLLWRFHQLCDDDVGREWSVSFVTYLIGKKEVGRKWLKFWPTKNFKSFVFYCYHWRVTKILTDLNSCRLFFWPTIFWPIRYVHSS